jgi:hypothetical protein
LIRRLWYGIELGGVSDVSLKKRKKRKRKRKKKSIKRSRPYLPTQRSKRKNLLGTDRQRPISNKL